MRREVETMIMEKAAKDKAFAKKLVANPNAAMKEFVKQLPPKLKLDKEQMKHLEETKFKVYVEHKNEFMIVIPAACLEDDALSDEDLRKVAGGDCKWICACRG